MKMIIPKTIAYDDFSTNLLDSTETEYDYTGGTTYPINTIVKVSFESDGTTRILPEKLFSALQEVTGDSYPPDTNSYWFDEGAVNRHMMFDKYINTQSVAVGDELTNPDEIVFTIDTGYQNAIALFGVDGNTIKYELTDTTGLVVYHTYTDEDLDSGYIEDFEEYIFNPFVTTHDVIHYFDTYIQSRLKVTITKTDVGSPKCGYVIVGESLFIGYTEYGAETGFLSFSKVVRDTFGNYYTSKGNTAKLMSLPLTIDNTIYDRVQAAAIIVDGVPTVFDGNNDDSDFESLIVLGLLIDFRPIIQYFETSECTMEIEGII